MKIHFEGPTDAPTGYGRAAREMAAALGDWLDDTADIWLVHSKPQEAPQGRMHGMRLQLLYTTWETEPFPKEWVASFNENYDAVLVPSDWCASILAMSGVEKVFALPHPLSFDFERRGDIARRDDYYHFYSIGTWNARKNTEGVLRAYLHEFSKEDQVQLTLLVSDPPFDQIQSVIARSGLPKEELPRLYVPDRYYSDAELWALHETSHCYVTAARAEGYGLGAAEAAAFENYVIAPSHTGFTTALRSYSWVDWAASFWAPVFPDRGRLEAQKQPDGRVLIREEGLVLPGGVDCRHIWCEPDLVSLATQMRYAYHKQKVGASWDGTFRAVDFRTKLQEIVSQL